MLFHGVCQLTIQTLGGEAIALSQTFTVMKTITHNTPDCVVSPSDKEATRNLVLADPTSDICAAVNVLLGVDMVFAVPTEQIVPFGQTAVGIKFGFVIMYTAPISSLCCSLLCKRSSMLIPPDVVCAHQLHDLATCVVLTPYLSPPQNDLSR